MLEVKVEVVVLLLLVIAVVHQAWVLEACFLLGLVCVRHCIIPATLEEIIKLISIPAAICNHCPIRAMLEETVKLIPIPAAIWSHCLIRAMLEEVVIVRMISIPAAT